MATPTIMNASTFKRSMTLAHSKNNFTVPRVRARSPLPPLEPARAISPRPSDICPLRDGLHLPTPLRHSTRGRYVPPHRPLPRRPLRRPSHLNNFNSSKLTYSNNNTKPICNNNSNYNTQLSRNSLSNSNQGTSPRHNRRCRCNNSTSRTLRG